MATLVNIPVNISDAITRKLFPTVTMWNRLEGRPRTLHFDKALKAEVRDALWMICKQWQMGEYKGEDAGSPVFAKIKINTSQISEYSAGNNPFKPLDEGIPMETLVEQKKIALLRNGNKIGLDIRLQLGNYWQKLLKSKSLANYTDQYVTEFGFALEPRSRDADAIYAHQDELRHWMAISGRRIDGIALIESIQAGSAASSAVPLSDPVHRVDLDELGQKLVKYYVQNFTQPEEESDNAWLPDRLEYKATCVANDSQEKNTLSAEEYYQGHLDWSSFNLKSTQGNADQDPEVFKDTFIPSPIEFDGMPDRRWWKFEDSKTSFGDVSPSTTDLGKLLLIEFGLTFANDWFLLPFDLAIGSISQIAGLTVKNNFGDVYWLQPTEKGNLQRQEWSIFRETSDAVNTKLFLSPSAIKVLDGEPLEEVLLLRDEMANMVWGVERVVPSSMGKGVQGGEYGLQKRHFHEQYVDGQAPLDYNADVYYQAMSDVAENWIPFVPVHADGHKRSIQLQRASVLRAIPGDPQDPAKIKPLTSLLRQGLEDLPKANPYLIHEEEISRMGTRVLQGFQRTRWLNGKVFVWYGAKKKTGRGEGSSGLQFDSLENVDGKLSG